MAQAHVRQSGQCVDRNQLPVRLPGAGLLLAGQCLEVRARWHRTLAPITGFTGGGLLGPGFGLAIDADDNAWMKSFAGKNNLALFDKNGKPLSPPEGANDAAIERVNQKLPDGKEWLANAELVARQLKSFLDGTGDVPHITRHMRLPSFKYAGRDPYMWAEATVSLPPPEVAAASPISSRPPHI
jgi:hypothetical protein